MGDQRDGPNPLLPAVLTAGISAYGDLRAAAGKPEEGLYLKTMAPMFAYTAAGQIVWAQRQAERAVEAVRRIFQRAEGEGIAKELDEASDLIEQAIPLIANEPSLDKRRMMEDIILNAARRSAEHGSAVQALEAISYIEALPATAALVLAAVAADPDGIQDEDGTWISAHGAIPLPRFIVGEAIQHLIGTIVSTEMGHTTRGDSIGWIRWATHVDPVSKRGTVERDRCILTPPGEWLAGWIKEHPESNEDAG